MTDMSIWIHIGATVLLAAGVCCFVAAFAEAIRMVFSSLFTVFYRPLSVVSQRTSAYVQSVKTWISGQLAGEAEQEGDGPVYYIIGSIIYSILTALFIFCDLGMVVLTVEAMGMEKASFALPIDTSTLTASTLVTTSLFWGAIFFDLIGVTHLAPWRKRLSVGFRRTFMVLSVFFFLTSVFIGMAMAYWRGYMTIEFVPEAEAANAETGKFVQGGLNIAGDTPIMPEMVDGGGAPEADLPPMDTSTNWVVYASLMGISGLSLSATAFSVVGLVMLFKFIIVLMISLCTLPLLPVTFVTWFASVVLDGIFNVVQRLIDFLVHVGSTILRYFGLRPEAERQAETTVTEDDGNTPGGENLNGSEEITTEPDPGFNPFSRR